MDKVPVSQLRVNTYYTAPLFLDGHYIILYPNLPITRDLINRLNEWRYTDIETSGLPSESIPSLKMNPLLESVSENSDDSFSHENDKLKSFESTLSRIYDICRKTGKIDYNAFFDFAKNFRSTIAESIQNYLSAQATAVFSSDFLISQSVRTAVLALAISETLKIPLYRQLELISAALLHKIGMVKIPKEIYLKRGALSEKEQELIRYYPVCPYRADFKKEPRGVIAILQNAKKDYDPNLCRVLLMILSLYPVGTMVLLKNNSAGIAFKVNPNDPRAPFVKLLTDPAGKPMMSERIVDTRSSEFQVVRVLTDEESRNIKDLFLKKP